MVALPLTKQLNIGQKLIVGLVDFVVSHTIGLVWDVAQFLYNTFNDLEEVPAVQYFEFTNTYPSQSIDTVVSALLGRKDKYVVHLKSSGGRSSWSITIRIIVKYSVDYSGTSVTGFPTNAELTWTRWTVRQITEG
jgi:hypothetical protein